MSTHLYGISDSNERIFMQIANGSEIAQMKAEFDLHNMAAYRALHGFAQGTAQHEIITARMERMGEIHEKLKGMIGEQKAIEFMVEVMSDKQKDELPEEVVETSI